MYNNYTNARDHAWQFLIRHNVRSLPIDVFKLCRKDKIALIPYSSPQAKDMATLIGAAELMNKTDGFTVQIGSTPLIFWDDGMPEARQRFTVAHELGHIVNGDIGAIPTERNKEPSDRDDPKETAANVFASRILAPACVLWALKVRDADTVAELCAISQTAAKWRYARLESLYDRERHFLAARGLSCFLMSPLEQQVFKQFKRYIHKHIDS